MLPILLLSCAKTSVSTVQPKSSVEVLQTIDLRTEFSELNDTEWVYELSRWTVPSQQTLDLNSNSGWKILDGEWDVADNGFVDTTQKISNRGDIVGYVLVATIHNVSENEVAVLPIQNPIADEVDSEGIVMRDTWTQPLVGFPLPNKNMRFRWVELAANGRVGKHTHESRPSLAYIIDGDLVEHRGDRNQDRGANDSVAERNGLTHWWENGQTPASIVVFDIVD